MNLHLSIKRKGEEMHPYVSKIFISMIFSIIFLSSNFVDANREIFVTRPVGSTSCYCNKGEIDSGEWIIEASLRTLKELQNEKSLASATIKNVYTVLKKKSPICWYSIQGEILE